MQPHIVANLPCQQRMLLGRIIPNQQDCWCREDICHAGGGVRLAAKDCHEGREIRRAMMIDVIGLQHSASKLGKEIRLLVCGTREPITPIADPPSLSRTTANLFPTSSNASSQVA